MNLDNPSAVGTVEWADVIAGADLARRGRNRWVRTFNGIGVLGKDPVLYSAGATALVLGLLTGRERWVRFALAQVASVALADSVKQAIKTKVSRSRPDELIDEGTYRRHSGGTGRKRDKSFPSGHAARCMAAAFGIARFHPAVGKIGLAIGALTAFSRILKGKHWPSDMLVGSAIGWGSEKAVSKILFAPAIARITRKLCRKFPAALLK